MNNNFKILAIETSCDETAAAVISYSHGETKILSNIISSQADLHAKTNGVVPEVASRAHMEAIVPVVQEALAVNSEIRNPKSETNFNFNKLEFSNLDIVSSFELSASNLKEDIDYLAVTAGPGLIGSLLVGFNAVKTMAYALNKPIIPINHIEGHIYSVIAELSQIPNTKFQIPSPQFPILCMTASGGHTLLLLVKDHLKYEVLGETLDDAVGEAYDKVAKLLNLGYPGGPIVAKLAGQFRNRLQTTNYQLPTKIVFPRPVLNDHGYDFSFSGLKTAVLQKVKEIGELSEENKKEICYAFEEAVAEVLSTKIAKAATQFEPKAVAFTGGVSANGYLADQIKAKIGDLPLLVPAKGLSGDNAAMIGLAAVYHVLQGDTKQWNEIEVDSNLAINSDL